MKKASKREETEEVVLKKYYFTFGSGQINQGKCQPILAVDGKTARETMESIYGNKWSTMYTEEEYVKGKEVGLITEIEMREVVCS